MIKEGQAKLKTICNVGITPDVGHSGHYCLIDSVTSTDPKDPYREPFIPVSVQFYLYHLFSCDYRASCI
jgi:hypothetical protein